MFQFSLKKYLISILSSTLQVHGLGYTQAYLIKRTSSILLFAKGSNPRELIFKS